MKDEVVGLVFGKLTIMGRAESGIRKSGSKFSRVNCLCECGSTKTIALADLRKGSTRSCGCSKQEFHRAKVTRHGMKWTPTWKSWQGMMERCRNKSGDHSERYAKRGIEVCERWHLFENFLADMGTRPEGKTLDRINNDGNYEPSNCRWATQEEQSNNKGNNVFLEYKGERKTVYQWARVVGMNPATLERRIGKYKWPVERALTEPVQKRS